MNKKDSWKEFDETWGISERAQKKEMPTQGVFPQKKDIITRTREKLLNYWIERRNQKNQKNS